MTTPTTAPAGQSPPAVLLDRLYDEAIGPERSLTELHLVAAWLIRTAVRYRPGSAGDYRDGWVELFTGEDWTELLRVGGSALEPWPGSAYPTRAQLEEVAAGLTARAVTVLGALSGAVQAQAQAEHAAWNGTG